MIRVSLCIALVCSSVRGDVAPLPASNELPPGLHEADATWTFGNKKGIWNGLVMVWSPSTKYYVGDKSTPPSAGEQEVSLITESCTSADEFCGSWTWTVRVKRGASETKGVGDLGEGKTNGTGTSGTSGTSSGSSISPAIRAGTAGALGIFWLALVGAGVVPLRWATAGLVLFVSVGGVVALTSQAEGNWQVTAAARGGVSWKNMGVTDAKLVLNRDGTFSITPASWTGLTAGLGSLAGTVTPKGTGGLVPGIYDDYDRYGPKMTLDGKSDGEKFVATSKSILNEEVTAVYPRGESADIATAMEGQDKGPKEFCFETASGVKTFEYNTKKSKTQCEDIMFVLISEGCGQTSSSVKAYGEGVADDGACPPDTTASMAAPLQLSVLSAVLLLGTLIQLS